MAASIPSGCQQFFEQYIPMGVICIIALSQNRFKIFSLCRYKAAGTAASRSCRSAPGRPAPITTKKTASRKPPSRRKATDLSPSRVLSALCRRNVYCVVEKGKREKSRIASPHIVRHFAGFCGGLLVSCTFAISRYFPQWPTTI